jgi:hypothetical protein
MTLCTIIEQVLHSKTFTSEQEEQVRALVWDRTHDFSLTSDEELAVNRLRIALRAGEISRVMVLRESQPVSEELLESSSDLCQR